MRRAVRLILLLALALMLPATALPARTPAGAEDCCATMNAGASGQQHNCEKKMPKTPAGQQCCAACFLNLYLATRAPLLFRPALRQSRIAQPAGRFAERFLRPPVPPPRRLAV